MLKILGNILCNPKVKVKDKKRVYAMVYHRLQSSFCTVFMILFFNRTINKIQRKL